MCQKIYLGPDRPFGLPLMKNAILAAEPEKIFPQAKKYLADRSFRRLFVSPENLAEARKAVNSPGSVMNEDYTRVARQSKGDTNGL